MESGNEHQHGVERADAVTGLAQQIAALRHAPTDALVARFTELHGHAPHVRHPLWLWKRIAWKLQEREYGGLSQVARSPSSDSTS